MLLIKSQEKIFIEKNSLISGSTQFKPMFFKGQLYLPTAVHARINQREVLKTENPLIIIC